MGNNVRVVLPWPDVWLLAYRLSRDGGVGVCTAGKLDEDQKMMAALDPQREEVLSELPPGSTFGKFKRGGGVTFRTERKSDDFANDDEKRAWLSATLKAYVNVLSPRIKPLVQSR